MCRLSSCSDEGRHCSPSTGNNSTLKLIQKHRHMHACWVSTVQFVPQWYQWHVIVITMSPSPPHVARVQRPLTTGSRPLEDDQIMKEVLLGANDHVDSAEQEVEVELEAEDDYGTGDTYATYKPAKGTL